MDDGRVTMAEVRRTVGRPNAAQKTVIQVILSNVKLG